MTDLGWADARRLAHGVAEPLPAVDVPVADAVGLVLAAPLVAGAPLPAFDTAAMDGFAVAGPGPWRLTGRRLAGTPAGPPLAAGCATEIATGAVVPEGAIAVLPYEDAARDGDLVAGECAPDRHIRRAGEECRRGEQVVAAGAVVTPPAAGLAAAVGLDTLLVHPAPRVVVVVSGDELLTSGLPREGRIRDALGPQLPALVEAFHGVPAGVRHVPDDADALAAALSSPATAGPDVVVTTGSSSVGPADHLHRVLADAGAQVHVRGVACRPGHPQLLARWPDGPWVVGLPGNPLAALVAVVTLLGPLLAGLAGRPLPRLLPAPLAAGLQPHPSATRLVPVVLDPAGRATPLEHGGSAMLRGMAGADGLAAVPPGPGAPPAVEVALLRG